MQLHILKNMYCIFVSIPGGCSVTLGETNTLGACLVKVTVRRSCTLPRSEDLSEPSPPSVFSKAEEATTLKQDHPHVSMRSRFQVLWSQSCLLPNTPLEPHILEAGGVPKTMASETLSSPLLKAEVYARQFVSKPVS